jgi:hypothetical protein
MNEGKLLAEEVARRAKELYEREIGSNLEPRTSKPDAPGATSS